MTEAARHLKVLCRLMPTVVDESYIISCPEARTMIVSNKPISRHLLNIRSQKNLTALKSTLLEDSTLIKFDGIIEENLSQSKLFNIWLKSPTQDLLTGKSFSLLVFGTTGSGKSYTIRGGEGKKRGLALRSVELLLTILERYKGRIQLKVSVTAILDEKLVDLLSKKTPAQEVLVAKASDFHAALSQALKIRKSVGDRQNKDKIHMIIGVRLYQDSELLSEAFFVELAGSEYAREDKQVARSFNAVSSQLTHSYSNWQSSLLNSCIGGAMDIWKANPASVFVICCASQCVETFSDTLAAMKFTSRIKECIEKDANRPELAYIENLMFYIGQSGLEDVMKMIENIEITMKLIQKEGRQLRGNEGYMRFKQIAKDTLNDIEEAKRLHLNSEDSTRQQSEFSQLKLHYSQLQDQYSSLLEEKSQSGSSFFTQYGRLIDDVLGLCRQLITKIEDEKDIQRKVAAESKNIKNFFNSKAFEREGLECSCSDDLKNLHIELREMTEDRKKALERLEACLKENRVKEEYIKDLSASSNGYEKQNQELNAVIADYESLIYELRKSLNTMSSKINQLEEEKKHGSQENERLRSHYLTLKEKISDQKSQTEREILKYKCENDDLCEKYNNLLSKIESMALEITKSKLTNNHLKIQTKSLTADIENINLPEIDQRVKNVYQRLKELEEGLAESIANDVNKVNFL